MKSTIIWDTDQTFTSVLDGPVIEKYIPGDLIIEAGVTVTTSLRCKGLHIQVMGNMYHYGTITMTERGANVAGQNVGIEAYSDRNEITYDDVGWAALPASRQIPAAGGAGGLAVSSSTPLRFIDGSIGTLGVNGQSGGGGSGGLATDIGLSGTATNTPGGPGISFGGGPGSGGSSVAGSGVSGYLVGTNGGAGGAGWTDIVGGFSGGGAGNPGGAGVYYGNPGESGTGGLIILTVVGYCYIGTGAFITADGAAGGVATTILTGVGPAGAGSGGGSINIQCASYTNNGTLQAAGGLGGYGGPTPPLVFPYDGSYGGDGGAGTTRISLLGS